MQLYYSTTSPFARKVYMLALAAKLPGLELVRANPLADETLRAINPLGKIPALVDGELTLIDSPLICEYLDDKSTALGNPGFFHNHQTDYYLLQRTHALADGVMDAAVATVMERRRADSEQSSHWLKRWHLAIANGLTWLETQDLGSASHPHIGTFATVAALGYLDFRLPDLLWRNDHPTLARWYAGMEAVEWAATTKPRDA
ncbi:MAG: glutathione S-transferase N-terminal domain-containing protein [Cellvibrionaceae bacterium]|nr:glutathione S-transferase N-terminal domain-containing protein [Cellvibrionaceae bacterium]